MNNSLMQSSKDYSRIEQAIRFLEANAGRQPALKDIAGTVGMSEYHFQRVFQRWAGISPKRFLQFLTKEHAKQLLKNSNLLDASYDAGLSGPGRLHDLFIACEAMSPGEYKQKGRGLAIAYGFHPTPFGECFMAVTDRGICSLQFVDQNNRRKILEDFRKDWKNAGLKKDQLRTRDYIKRIFVADGKKGTVRVLCRGSNFQIKVWEALLRIPSGTVVSYRTVAHMIGSPQATRAVGNAVGKNAIAYLIPCHRVIRGLGHLGGYRWGTSRKRAMLAIEFSERNGA